MPELNVVPAGEGPVSAQASGHAEAASLIESSDTKGLDALTDLAVSLGAKSPSIAAILQSSAVRAQVDTYKRLDAEAERQQRRFMIELTAANVCLMAVGVLSGIVLAVAPLASAPGFAWASNLPLGLGGITLVLGALAAMLTYKARESDRLRRWMSCRSGAEMARIATFQAIAAAAVAAGPGVAGEALLLIRTHLLDDQRRWQETRANRHRRSSDWTTSWGGLATALAFVGGSGAVIAGFVPSQTWLAVVGVFGAAIGAYAVNREGLRRDRANADRYENGAAALDALAARHDTVAGEISAGRADALAAYTTAITDQLAAEHKQWLDGATQVESLVVKLDAELQGLRGQGKSEAH
jgi:hypothetical protein